METVLGLIDDARLLAAKKEYDKIMRSPDKCSECADAMSDHKPAIDLMLERCAEVDRSIELVSAENEDWILATRYLGVSTHYMLGDDGYLWVRMESAQADVPVLEQLAVVYEVELFKTWVPFCTNSRLITRLSHTELIAYACIGTPFGLSRESIVHAYGVDCIYETGSLVVVGESIEEFEGVDLPPCKGMLNKRAIMQFSAVVTPYSPTSGHMVVVAKVDPKLALPQSVVNFVTKQLAGFFLVMVYQQAREIASKEDSIYRKIILENKEFYVDWVLPRVRALFSHRGWEQPVIACLGELGYPVDNTGATMASTGVQEEDNRSESPVEDPAESMFIEGILHKKGNAMFYTTWSLRYFELDVRKQKLKWYRCKPGGKKGVLRGEIHLAKASACIKTAKQSNTNQKGHLIALNYIPMNSSDTMEMTLLSSTLEEAYQWIAHTNKSGSYYDMPSPGIEIQSEEEGSQDLSDRHLLAVPISSPEDIGMVEKAAEEEKVEAVSGSTIIAADQNNANREGTLTARAEYLFGRRLVAELWRGVVDLGVLLTPLGPLLLPEECQLVVYIALLYAILLFYCTTRE